MKFALTFFYFSYTALTIFHAIPEDDIIWGIGDEFPRVRNFMVTPTPSPTIPAIPTQPTGFDYEECRDYPEICRNAGIDYALSTITTNIPTTTITTTIRTARTTTLTRTNTLITQVPAEFIYEYFNGNLIGVSNAEDLLESTDHNDLDKSNE